MRKQIQALLTDSDARAALRKEIVWLVRSTMMNTEQTLIDGILSHTNLASDQYSYDIATTGMQSLLTRMFELEDDGDEIKIDKRFVEDLIDELDGKMSQQMDEIIHHPEFKALEAPWRNLKFLTDRTEFGENIEVSLLSVSKDDLLADFDDATDITESGLYRKVYTEEFGQFGGNPFGVLIGNTTLHQIIRWSLFHGKFIGDDSRALYCRRDVSHVTVT